MSSDCSPVICDATVDKVSCPAMINRNLVLLSLIAFGGVALALFVE